MAHHHDPDGLAAHTCCMSPAERERDRLEKLAMHAAWLARRTPIVERDRRFRRIGQSVLGVAAVAAVGTLFTLLWSISRYLDGESLGVVDTLASKLTVGGLFTTFGVLRMLWGWHKRSRASAVVRAADAASTLLPTSR